MVKSPAKKVHDEAPKEHVDEAHELHLEAPAEDTEITQEEGDMIATVATVGVIGIGVAIVEAALLPGVILGVAAVAAPKYVPKLGSWLGPMFKSTVRGVYRFSQKTKEFMAETHEHVQDIVAEVDAEGAATAAKGAGAPLQ